MKIKGKYLAWALIHFSFFLTFVFIDSEFVNFEESFIEVFGSLIVYVALWIFFGWRFIKNMEEAFN